MLLFFLFPFHPRSPDSYGYQTSTRVRIVLVLALQEETVRDNDVKTVSMAMRGKREQPPAKGFGLLRSLRQAIVFGYKRCTVRSL